MYRIKTSDNIVNYFGVLRSWNLDLRAVHIITYNSIESYSSILWLVVNIPNCFCNSREWVLSVCVFVCFYILKGLWWCYRSMVTVVAAGLDIVQFPSSIPRRRQIQPAKGCRLSTEISKILCTTTITINFKVLPNHLSLQTLPLLFSRTFWHSPT